MDKDDIVIIIILTSFSSFVTLFYCLRYYKNYHREKNEKNRLSNIHKILISKKRIKPISEIIDEEIKNEFLQYEIRTPQITGEENV